MKDCKALLLPNNYYHVFNEAVGSEKLFVIADNYRYFFQRFNSYISPLADLLCFCLLPSHFHFFIRIKDINTITTRMGVLNYRHGHSPDQIPVFLLQQFSNCFNAYTKAFNKQQIRKGKLFTEPFNRKAITDPECYAKIVHYIHANPVHHRFCSRIKGWPYSSYHELINQKTCWIKHEEVIKWFGSVEEFKTIHEQAIERKFTNK